MPPSVYLILLNLMLPDIGISRAHSSPPGGFLLSPGANIIKHFLSVIYLFSYSA